MSIFINDDDASRMQVEAKIERKQKERKRVLRTRSLVATGVFLFLGGISVIGTGIAKNDEKHFSLREAEREILIHSGYAEYDDGHDIDPRLPHGCEIPNDGRTVQERLNERMEEEGYAPQTISAAEEKYNLLTEGEYDAAMEIDLQQVEKEAKENRKSARIR